MREIELTQGRVAIVDDEDYNAVAQYQWQLLANRREGRKTDYAVGKENGTRKAVLMHRYVAEFSTRWNMMALDSDQRLNSLLESTSGLRLTYKRLIAA